MIASLMMYNLPQMRPAISRYWQTIRVALEDHGIAAPTELSQDTPAFEVWTHPDLILSQTCGMPYRQRLAGKVNYVGTPDLGLTDCPPGYYRSAFVVRMADTRSCLSRFSQATFAVNETLSQSGWAAPWAHLNGWWFSRFFHSGGHVESAKAVASGQADIAALDAQTWRLLCRHDPVAEQLRVLEWTAPTPGLPYITARQNDPAIVAKAVRSAITSLSISDRQTLCLYALIDIPPSAYLSVPNPPDTLGI